MWSWTSPKTRRVMIGPVPAATSANPSRTGHFAGVPSCDCHCRRSDAIVLFDGKDLLQWQSQDGTPAKWPVRDGVAEGAAGTGPIIKRRVFWDVQLPIEW